jgi:Rrf2 family nitric oxide-sensitive transcriptional repressor
MRLTTFTDYGLRVLIFAAARPDRTATIAQVAKAFDISENHLTKVVHFLGRAGLLATTRGKGGGVRLAKAPGAINVAEVVRLTEMQDVPAECFDPETNACAITQGCRLRGVLGEAVRSFYAVLGKYTLEHLVQNRSVLEKILFLPQKPRSERRIA